jgi:hypothetical protein
MSLLPPPRNAVLGALLAALLLADVPADASMEQMAGEHSLFGLQSGDQTRPAVSLSPAGGTLGGCVVWQDNTLGPNQTVHGRALDSHLAPAGGAFQVSSLATGEQKNPRVATLKNQGVAFVWQGGLESAQHIYARFLSPALAWTSTDVPVSQAPTTLQEDPDLACLVNGNVVLVWSSLNQEAPDSLRGVYARIFSPQGAPQGNEIALNTFTPFNQAHPAVAALADGRFVAVWVSQQQRQLAAGPDRGSVDIYGRIFSASGVGQDAEFLINTADRVCANPRVAAGPTGGFLVAWNELDPPVNGQPADNSWDVYARVFDGQGVGGTTLLVNSERYGDQVLPQVATLNENYLAVWVSLAQDGSAEGVFGKLVGGKGTLAGGEFRVNASTASIQTEPAVATDAQGNALAVWTSFQGVGAGMDLLAQRYFSALPVVAMAAPYLNRFGLERLLVSWSAPADVAVDHYQIFVDGAATAAIANQSYWIGGGFVPSTSHSFQVAYVLANGAMGPLSTATTERTWGPDTNGDGMADEWQTLYFGASWPAAAADHDRDGSSNLGEFLAGTDPKSSLSALRVGLQPAASGFVLSWTTVPGLVYQVQTRVDLGSTGWTDLGAPQVAAGLTGAFNVGRAAGAFYRVMLVQ